jgi:hypothetical protein
MERKTDEEGKKKKNTMHRKKNYLDTMAGTKKCAAGIKERQLHLCLPRRHPFSTV